MTQHQAKARRASWSLAVVAIVMVFAAAAAVFAPSGGGKKTTSLPLRHGLGLFIHPPTYPPASQSASPTPSTPATQWPTPRSVVPVAYPLPARTYPAPVHTYPPPVRTYPAPTPRPPSPPPGSDLAPALPLLPPIEGVVTSSVAAWDANTSSQAVLATAYVSMAQPLPPSWLHSVMRVDNGANPLVVITPTAPGQPKLTLEQIAAGKADPWLDSMKAQITALGRPVVISFAPEANGNWYSWSLDPAGFIAAWQHVHGVIGTSGVLWMWQMSAHNAGDPANGDFAPYWPGSGLVDWVGLDGYYYAPGDTFNFRFAQSLAEVATLTSAPVIIAETSVSPLVGSPQRMAADVADLFAGIKANNLLGLVYFDLNACPPAACTTFRQDFRLESSPAALAAYRVAVSAW